VSRSLVLFIEGRTETYLPLFLKRWLDERLSSAVRVNSVKFDGVGDYRRKFASRARLDLGSDRVIGILGLIDLYHCRIEGSPEEIRNRLEQQVQDHRFRQHLAVHEVEAWLLSDREIFPRPVREALPDVSRPESIDAREPPAKLLDRLYLSKLNRGYAKVRDGAKLFSALRPNLAYERCPHLRPLLDDMLDLAKAAGY
jgi:hypothetical protein